MESMNAFYIIKSFAVVAFIVVLLSLLVKYNKKIGSDTTNKSELINQILINILFLFSVFFIIIMTLLYPAPSAHPTSPYNIKNNYVPLDVISELIRTRTFNEMAYNIVGNIVLFLPFGFLLPLKNKRMKKFTTCVAVGYCFSVGIELCQLLLPQRQTDIDDVLLNTLGVILGYCLYRFYRKSIVDISKT